MEISKFNLIVHIGVFVSFIIGMAFSFVLQDEETTKIFLCLVLTGEVLDALLTLVLTKGTKKVPISAAKLGNVWKIPREDVTDQEDLKRIIKEIDPENTPYDNVYQVTYKNKFGFLYHETKEFLTKEEYEKLLEENNLIAVDAKTKEMIDSQK